MSFWPPVTRFYPDTRQDWRIWPVTLAPALLGLVVGLLIGAIGFGAGQGELIGLGLAFVLLWQLYCLSDLHSVFFLWKHGRWPEDEELL